MTLVKRSAGAVALGAAAIIGFGLSAPPARAGYIVTLTQQGSNVVASGSGTIDLTGLSFGGSFFLNPFISPSAGAIVLGPVPSEAVEVSDGYTGFMGPANFGPQPGHATSPNGGSGDLAGIDNSTGRDPSRAILVPHGYVSGNSLSDTSTYDNQTFASLGVTPGTYVWTWGSGANADSFTLVIGGTAAVPEPSALALLGAALTGLFLITSRLKCRDRRARADLADGGVAQV